MLTIITKKYYLIYINMSLASSTISVNSRKTGTPFFGGLQEPIKNVYHISRECNDQQQQQYNMDTNIPQAIMQRSSNSSEDCNVLKFQDYRENKDIQIVFIKQQTQNSRPRIIKREKSKSYYDGTAIHTNSLLPIFKTQKQEPVYSSLGVPASFQNSRKKTILEQKQAEQDCRLCKSGGWTRTKLMLTQSRLAFFQFSFDVKDLEKIKILPWINSLKTKSENIIKVAYKNQVQLFSLSTDKKNHEVPTSYYIFSKLVQKRLQQGQSLQISNWEKQDHIVKKVIEDSFIYGNIYKKSQMLGNWQKRYVVIKRNGIYSYRNSSQDENFSFYISSDSIKYMWTRFEKVEGFLIVKIKHGLSKTQFGIPICEFSTRSTTNWLYYLYRVIPVIDVTNQEQR